MTRVALSLHLLAVALTVGPVTVAAALFPRAVREGDPRLAAFLHRTCRVYGVLGLAVPTFGILTAVQLGVLDEPWIWAALVLTLVAGVLLGAVLVPAQRAVLTAVAPAAAGPDGGPAPAPAEGPLRRLGTVAGVFSLLWAVVLVLMVFRPGSTTGA